MPRENVHWKVIRRTLERSPLIEGVYFPLAMLGAMLPDAPYHVEYGKSEAGEKLGAALHGKDGEDTYQLIRALGERAYSNSDKHSNLLLALLVGILSHIETDAVFHPLVFYYTGNYNAADRKVRTKARRNHRLFETFLDCHLADFAQLKLVDWSRKIDEEELSFCLRTLDELTAVKSDFWQEATKDLCELQSAYVSTFKGLLAAGISFIKPDFRQFETLFNLRRRGRYQVFDDPLQFKNPVSGEQITTNLHEMIEQATTNTIARLQSIQSGQELPWGPSLNSGLPKTTPKDFVHFSDSRFALPGL